MTESKSLWKLLWDFDPNGLVVFDASQIIRIVNPAFCQMFSTTAEEAVAQPAARWLDDVEELWHGVARGREKFYEQHGLYVRQVVFHVPEENLVACIMVDVTPERRQERELLDLKRETLAQVKQVVDKQMSVAQEIASLLGETTAETKASLLRLARMVEEEGRSR